MINWRQETEKPGPYKTVLLALVNIELPEERQEARK